MKEKMIAFLEKYQEMRATQKDYFKTKNKGFLIRAKQMELDLDKEAELIKNALTVN